MSAGTVGLAGLMLEGCDRLSHAPRFQNAIGRTEDLTKASQRLLLTGQPLAKEFSATQISPVFKPNGSVMPDSDAYQELMANNFADWRLVVEGLVRRPVQLSLDQLKAMPARTQITRHDCVEGWSAVGQWTGVQLARVLNLVSPLPQARYVVFRCADDLANTGDASGLYYESIDFFDALHPQTILAYELNGKPLPVANGAPLRLRVERQLGYKQAKYVMRIQLVDRLDQLGRGKGGFWEDRGYAWYAGI
ncbi:MAG: molybdopterin-binding protein [Caulobacteraceae bacterium]|nr:molybdopterin-binding protein [Caulobacteraceae bacterium]